MHSIIIELPEETDQSSIESLNDHSYLFSFPADNKPDLRAEIIKGQPHLVKFHKPEIDSNPKDPLPSHRSQILCILAVPNWINDFYSYLLSQSSDLISECRENLVLIHTILSSHYFSTVLLYFSNQSAADNFYTLFSGRDFSEPSNEFCYICFISEINFSKTLVLKRELIELPLCPVCMERLDVNISGVLGVLRTESTSMLEKRWAEAGINCKVCKSLESSAESQGCQVCNEGLDVWACLVCGHKGCGRYQAAHGKYHFDYTGHNFAIELNSQRIWDYLTDNYVHRLLHSGRGTLVLDSQFSPAAKESVERMVKEYNHLISLQLDQQRVYYEQKISSILINKSENLHEEFKVEKVENDYLKRQISKMKAHKRKKATKETFLSDLMKENLELEEMNKNLKEFIENPHEVWMFEDKKSKNTFLKLQRLKTELQSLMSSFS